MKVVAISGSPRLQGYTSHMIDYAFSELTSRGIECEKIILNKYKLSPCQACEDCRLIEKCHIQDDAPWIIEKYSQADGIIMASPVYLASVSAQIKIFMDRSTFLFRHNQQPKAKCAGLIAICGRGGAEDAVTELKKPFRAADAELLTIAAYGGRHERDPEELVEVMEQARDLGRQMAEILTGKSG